MRGTSIFIRFLFVAVLVGVWVALIGASWGWTMPVPPERRPFRVVLDPGHGGADFGTVYQSGKNRIAEKDIALLIALQTAEHLRRKGYLVQLTRERDEDLPLPARTAFANRVKADVFLSIHLNSSTTPMIADPGGVETYILNNTTDASSRRLAYVENKMTRQKHEEVDDLSLILKDLRLDANMSGSKRLACALQDTLVRTRAEALGILKKPSKPGMPVRVSFSNGNRGVRQALFYVLLGADMPSALLETGFLTSPRDRELLLSPEGRLRISRSIASALEQYKRAKTSAKLMSELSNCKVN